MKKISLLFMTVLTLGIFSFGVLTLSASALEPKDSINAGIKDSGGNENNECVKSDGKKVNCFKEGVRNVINVLLYIIGAVAVIMIVIGGLRYTISNGDSSQITGAKNTILYAVVGLVVAILAYAIVNFIVNAF
jgi:hypothetical protein